MSTPTPDTPEQDSGNGQRPQASTALVIDCGLLTGLSFGAAMQAADPENSAINGLAWSTASCLSLLSAGGCLKKSGMISIEAFTSGLSRSVVRVGAMAGPLFAVNNYVSNPDSFGAFGIAAAATIAGAAVLAMTNINIPRPSRKPGM